MSGVVDKRLATEGSGLSMNGQSLSILIFSTRKNNQERRHPSDDSG
ncbi:MAG: hypothetical protein ABF656_00355 [Lentilactobacillus hilgardii]